MKGLLQEISQMGREEDASPGRVLAGIALRNLGSFVRNAGAVLFVLWTFHKWLGTMDLSTAETRSEIRRVETALSSRIDVISNDVRSLREESRQHYEEELRPMVQEFMSFKVMIAGRLQELKDGQEMTRTLIEERIPAGTHVAPQAAHP